MDRSKPRTMDHYMTYRDHDTSIYQNPETGEETAFELDDLKRRHLVAADRMQQMLQEALDQHPTKHSQLQNAQSQLRRFQEAISAL